MRRAKAPRPRGSDRIGVRSIGAHSIWALLATALLLATAACASDEGRDRAAHAPHPRSTAAADPLSPGWVRHTPIGPGAFSFDAPGDLVGGPLRSDENEVGAFESPGILLTYERSDRVDDLTGGRGSPGRVEQEVVVGGLPARLVHHPSGDPDRPYGAAIHFVQATSSGDPAVPAPPGVTLAAICRDETARRTAERILRSVRFP